MILVIRTSSPKSQFKTGFSHPCQKVSLDQPIVHIVAEMWEQISVKHIANSPCLVLLRLPCRNNPPYLVKRILLCCHSKIVARLQVLCHELLNLGVIRDRCHEVRISLEPERLGKHDKVDFARNRWKRDLEYRFPPALNNRQCPVTVSL
uniref:Uncharacterized protein n=1 Tax=Candidatus Methanogaster sp. ANME-2c ERB4 TaxID=2759911 RepID=A0A7G9YBN3_9EURY|nr:hypothetical protein PANLPDEM_00005 [Methanosarcinales archaeon ANME-2c ERB4]